LFLDWIRRKRGLSAEDAEVGAQSSVRRGRETQEHSQEWLCHTNEVTQERAGQAWPLQWEGGMELTEKQVRVVERLFEAGFRPIAIPPYESALIVHRGECAGVLGPVENGGLKLLVPVTILVDGNLSVKLKKSSGDVFVWKKKEVAATEERLKELEGFRVELVSVLEMGERSS
jgi:hypothetical protein